MQFLELQIFILFFLDPQDSKPNKDKVERSLQICELLIKSGCNVNGKNDVGMTPVMVALCQVHFLSVISPQSPKNTYLILIYKHGTWYSIRCKFHKRVLQWERLLGIDKIYCANRVTRK